MVDLTGVETEIRPFSRAPISPAQLDQTFALLETLDCLGPERLQPRQQRIVRAVAFADPHQRNRCWAQQPSIDEVLVLRHEDAAVCCSVLPDGRITGGVQGDVDDVDGLMSAARDPSRQRRRKLRIDDELQASRTAWSAWRAA